MLLLVFTAACSDEFDQPPMVVPVAEHTANISIADFKAKHWQDERNFIDTVKEDEVIHGWITSSDEAGNVYKQIYISDGTAGLTVSIDQSSLYNKYREGQEVVIPMKGYFIGKFNGTYCLGIPYWYEQQAVWESNRMPMEMWEKMTELNGFPDLAKVDTTLIELNEIKDTSDPQVLLKYMSRLVRINGVSFDEGGEVYAVPNDNNKNTIRVITDDDGNKLNVSNSQYASFRSDTIPKGVVDVVGQLSYTASDGFFLILRRASDVIVKSAGGTKRAPYKVEEAIAGSGTGMRGWVGGYAVGAVAGAVTTVTSNDDIEWKAPTTLDNTIVLADDPECKDFRKCIIVPLPVGSMLRKDANLETNPNVYQSFVKVKGEFGPFMGIVGVMGNTGSTSEYVLDVAVQTLDETFDTEIPNAWNNVAVSGSTPWTYYAYPRNNPNTFCAQIYNTGSASQTVESWLITPKLDIKKAKSKVFSFTSEVNNSGNIDIEVYLIDNKDPRSATVMEKLNPILPSHPSSGYSAWTPSGDIDLSRWSDGSYYIGFRYLCPSGSTHTTWCIDNVTFGMGAPSTMADFQTMGTPVSTLGTFTSANGWVARNSTLLVGGTGSNPEFAFIGYVLGSTSEYAKAPTMNGGTDLVGTIVSPTLQNGLSKLRFNYGAAFSGSVISFRVDVKQNGNVVKSWTVTENPMTQKYAYSFEGTCSVSGDFTIEFTNLCPSGQTGDKRDRFSVWNVNWDNAD